MSSRSSHDARERARTSAAVLRCHEEKRLPGRNYRSLVHSLGRGQGRCGSRRLSLSGHATSSRRAGGTARRWRSRGRVALARVSSGYTKPQRVLAAEHVGGRAPYWQGIQLDETALPVLLVDLLQRDGVDAGVIAAFWPMVRHAASYIVRHGPATEQDRWEEEPGFAPFTMAVEIAALLIAADLADRESEASVGAFLRETADAWNDSIEECLYVTAPICPPDRHRGLLHPYCEPETADAASPKCGSCLSSSTLATGDGTQGLRKSSAPTHWLSLSWIAGTQAIRGS